MRDGGWEIGGRDMDINKVQGHVSIKTSQRDASLFILSLES